MEDCTEYPGSKLLQAFKFPAVDGTAPYHLAFDELQTQNENTDESDSNDAKPYATACLRCAIENGLISVNQTT